MTTQFREAVGPDEVMMRFHATQLDLVAKERRRKILVFGTQLIVTAAFLLVWELLIRMGVINPIFMGRPATVFSTLWARTVDGTFLSQAVPTFKAVLLSFLLASGSGILIGIALHEFLFLNRVVQPMIALLNSIPRIALAPMTIVWFGLGLASKTALAISLVIFIIIISTQAALKNVDDYLLLLGRSLGANRWQRFAYIKLPWAFPGIFAGLRLGLVYSVLSVVVSEMMASPDGLGQLITFYSNRFDVSAALAALLFLSIITLALNGGINKVEKKLGTWEVEGTSS